MSKRMAITLATAVALAAGTTIGVARPRHHSPTPPASTPTGQAFTDAGGTIMLTLPAGWHRTAAKTAEVAVAAPAGSATLAVDVPAMSVHPWYIPVGLVASGYVDAMRKGAVPDAVVQQSADLTVAGATARRLVIAGHDRGGAAVAGVAVLMIHDRQVYIVSCDSDAATASPARETVDRVAASVRWLK